MSALKRTFTLTKERFENVDLSESQAYVSSIYRRASKSTGAAAAAARANVASAYTAATPHAATARDNVVSTTSSLWSNALSFARGIYKPKDPQIKAVLTRVAGAPFPRVGHTLAVVKGRAYIFGGESSPGHLANNDMNVVFLPAYEAQEVDYTHQPARPREKDGPVPAARKGHIAVVIGDVICIFGGELADGANEEEKEGRVWVFDTSSNTWTYLDPAPESPYPAPRHGHSATSSELPEPTNVQSKPDRDILPQQPPEAGEFPPEPAEAATWGTLFIYGGTAKKKAEEEKGEMLNDAWAFDLKTRQWHALSPPPGPARTGASLVCSGETVWRFGGFDGQGYVDAVDKLDVSRLWTFGTRGSALGDLAFEGGLGEWETMEFALGEKEVPVSRANAAAVEVSFNDNRGHIAFVGGQGRAGKAKGKGKEPAEQQLDSVPEDDSTRVLDDIWTFQIPTSQMHMAGVREDAEEHLAATGVLPPMPNAWKEVEYRHIDRYGDVKEDNESVEVLNQYKALRRRAGFAAAKGSEVEGSSFVVWGGVDGRGTVRSDGYMVTVET